MDAFVLSGGSLKGSYQAGAVAQLWAMGIRPGVVTGISVGALNAAFLAAHQDDADAGEQLARFWTTEVTGPGTIATKRGLLSLAWRVLRKDWDGLVDTAPLTRLAETTLGGKFPRAAGIQVRVGAVNLRTGALEYHAPNEPDFLHAVLASTAEPVTMPLRTLGSDRYCDGGVREITPLAEAIRLGATRIYCIVCQPETLPWAGDDHRQQ